MAVIPRGNPGSSVIETEVRVFQHNAGAPTSAVNEVETVTLANATGGTFKLSFGGAQTGALAYNATAATVQTALRALASINGANVTVTGSAGGPYTVTFIGTLAGAPQALMTADGAALTGSSPTVTVAEGTLGVVGTRNGFCSPGTLLVDTTNTNLYINTGTQVAPVWKLFTHA